MSVVYNPRTIAMARSFISSIVDGCRSCLRRNEENCKSCFARSAKVILREMEIDETVAPIDYSLYARMKRITDILSDAGRPMLSRDIRLDPGFCSYQLKLWTLKHMVKIGVLGRKVAFKKNSRRNYFYFLKSSGRNNKETKHENHTTRNR